MKTERRHELQTNKLADWTGSHLEQIRPHGKMILGIAILAAAIIVTAVVLIGDRRAAESQALNELFLAVSARDREALASTSKNHRGSWVALFANKSQADMDLENGLAAQYTNRDDSSRLLEDAKRSYEEIVTQGSRHPELVRHAMLGLARAYEATSNLEKARSYYEQLLRKFPGSYEAAQASPKLEQLKKPEVESYYNWFARQTPQPLMPPSLPNLPGFPDDLTKLPEKPGEPLFPVAPVTPPTTPVTPPTGERPDEPSKSPATAPPGSEASKPAPSDSVPPPSTTTAPGTTPSVPAPAAPAAGATSPVTPPANKPAAPNFEAPAPGTTGDSAGKSPPG